MAWESICAIFKQSLTIADRNELRELVRSSHAALVASLTSLMIPDRPAIASTVWVNSRITVGDHAVPQQFLTAVEQWWCLHALL